MTLTRNGFRSTLLSGDERYRELFSYLLLKVYYHDWNQFHFYFNAHNQPL